MATVGKGDQRQGKIYTTFVIKFYYEDFEQTIVKDALKSYIRDNGVYFKIEGDVIDNNNYNNMKIKVFY